MGEQHGLTKQKIFAELSKSPHGKLAEYVPVGKQAVAQEGEFFQHLIAWNFQQRTDSRQQGRVAGPRLGIREGSGVARQQPRALGEAQPARTPEGIHVHA